MQQGEAARGGMAMSNGAHQQPKGGDAGYSGMEPSGGIKMNLDLSWRQIVVVFGALWTMIGGMATGGIIFMPARDSEFQPVKQIVESMRVETSANRDAIARLTVAVDNLSGLVDRLKTEVPARVLEKVAPRAKR